MDKLRKQETPKVTEPPIVENTPVSTITIANLGLREIQQNPKPDTSRAAESPTVKTAHVPTSTMSTPSTSALMQNPEELEIANVSRHQQPSTSTGNMSSRNRPIAALELPDPVRNQRPEITGHFVKLTSKDYHHTTKKMVLININESLDEQSFAVVLGFLPYVTLPNTKVDISRMELFYHFVGPRNNPLKHIRIHYCYHLYNSVFLMIVKGKLAMLKSAHGWMHLNDANFEKKPSQPCLPVEERRISDKLFEHGRSSFSRDQNDELYASVAPIQVGNVRAFNIPPNLRTRLTEEFGVLIPHYVISTESVSPTELTGRIAELEFTLRYICQYEFQDVKGEVEKRLQETPHDHEPDSNLEGFITLDDSEGSEELVELEDEAPSTSRRGRKITPPKISDNKRKISPTQTSQSSNRKRIRISPPDDSDIIQEPLSTDRNQLDDRNLLCYPHFRYEKCANTARCRKRHRIRDIDYCARYIQQKCDSQETCPNMLRHLTFNQLQKEWRALQDENNHIEYVPTIQEQQAIDGLPIQHSKRDLASRLSDREDLANRLTNRRRNRRSPEDDLYSRFEPSQPLPIWDRLGPGEEVDLGRSIKTEPLEHREPRQPRNNRPICRYFQQGNCRYGDKCKNEHVQIYDISDEDDEDEVPKNSNRNFAFR